MEFISDSIRRTEALGRALGKKIKPGDVVALSGDLGAGKTAFVAGLAYGMGLRTRVTSPTFAIVNEYLGEIPLFHFDMYRLSGPDELFDIGWEDYLRAGGVCAVEWSEIVDAALPPDSIRVTIIRTGDNERCIRIEGSSLPSEEQADR